MALLDRFQPPRDDDHVRCTACGKRVHFAYVNDYGECELCQASKPEGDDSQEDILNEDEEQHPRPH